MKRSLLFILFAIISILPITAQVWTPQTSGSTVAFPSVYFVNDNLGFVVGPSGTIRKTTNGGTTWVPQTSGISDNLNEVVFADANTGYIVAMSGKILKTINGGTLWSLLTTGTTIDLTRITLNGSDIYVSGYNGLMLKSSDGGATWLSLTTGTSQYLYGTFFTDANTGYVAGNAGVILKTTNAGTSWTPLTSGTSSQLFSVYFTDANNGYMTGGDASSNTGVILKTTNAGVSWTSQTVTSNFFGNIRFLSPSIGYVSGGSITANTSTILKTTDAGATWLTETSSSSRQFGISFPSFSAGYSCGLNGTILKYSSPVSVELDARFTSSEPGCLGQLENFYSVMPATTGVTHSWSFGSGATPTTSTLVNPTGIVYSTAGAKLVTHIVSDGISADTVINIVTINPSPVTSFTSTAPVCVGNSINLTNTGTSSTGGVSYYWDFGAGASPTTSAAQNPTGITFNSPGTKIIIFSITNQYGCMTTTTQSIIINALPVANAGSDLTICANTSIQIGSSAVAGNTYSWTPFSTLSNNGISNPVASPIGPTTQYILTVINTSTGCIEHDTTAISMLSSLLANAGIDGEMCMNDSIQLGVGLIEGQTYSWSPATGLNDSTLSNPLTSSDTTITYTLSVSGYGCQAITDEVTIIVNPLPVANAGVDDTITVGSSILLNASGGIQYNWTPSSGLSNSGIYNPLASPENTMSYIVIVTDAHQCVNSDTVTITVITPAVWLPSAFTPDGNGSNDILFVRGEGIQDFEFSIFNRWGERIFLSTDMNIGWNGKRQIGGEELPEGSYVFFVKGTLSNAEPFTAKGLVNLVR
ncbi:MAG TPA: YCF48-related protein [Bacteroidia bacterium]